jgi:hypothetical protein
VRRGKTTADALDRLEYEDRALLQLVGVVGDGTLDLRQRDELVQQLVAHLAVREAARELVVEGLAEVDDVRDQAERLRAAAPDRSADVAQILPRLRRHIEADLGEIIPEIRRRVSAEGRAKVLPTARYVVRHAPMPHRLHKRKRLERIQPRAHLHALHEALRGVRGARTKRSAEAALLQRGEEVR